MTLKQESKQNDPKSNKAVEETGEVWLADLQEYLKGLSGKEKDLARDEWMLFKDAMQICNESIQQLNWLKSLLERKYLPIYVSDAGYDKLIILATLLRSIGTLKETRDKYVRRKSKNRRIRPPFSSKC